MYNTQNNVTYCTKKIVFNFTGYIFDRSPVKIFTKNLVLRRGSGCYTGFGHPHYVYVLPNLRCRFIYYLFSGKFNFIAITTTISHTGLTKSRLLLVKSRPKAFTGFNRLLLASHSKKYHSGNLLHNTTITLL